MNDPFSSAPDTARSLLETFAAFGVHLPEGAGTVVLDLGADPRCTAGLEIAKTDFERVVGGLRLILRALEQTGGVIAAGVLFREHTRLLRRLLGRGGNLTLLHYRPRPGKDSEQILSRKLGAVRTVSAELCRAAFRAVYEEAAFCDRLIAVHHADGCRYVRAPFGASCRQVLDGLQDLPTPARIVAGDLYSGTAVADPDAPLDNGVDALQLLTRRELPKSSPCIRCGTCMRVCPEGVKPFKVALGRKTNLDHCTLCGKCTYYCPAQLPLTERIAELKQEVTACEN